MTTDDTLQAARESFSGKTMTESQLQEAWAISGIIHGDIQKTGSFVEKLTDYTHAFARSERFDAMRGEKIIRDIYSARFGETMNQTREGLKAVEENLPDIAKTRALACAEIIGTLIQKAPTQPFYQAYDRAAVTLAREFGITQTGAKALMKETFQTHHGEDLYQRSKAIEDAYHKPVREAEIASRKAEKLQTRAQSQSMS